jgi:hypothetical protein
VSELLERIQREIRERLAASRAAVVEHERLEAALHALGEAGSRATRAVSSRGRDQGAVAQPSETTRRSGAAPAKPSRSRARSGERSPKPASTSKPGVRRSAGSAKGAGAKGSTSASARQPSSPEARASRDAASRPSRGSSDSAPAARGRATPARKRAPRGANREAVLRVIHERPGVTPRELAAASGVTGGTLSSLLRTLTQRGELEKRPLAGGQTGYQLTASADAGAPPAPAQPTGTPTTTEPAADPTPEPAVEPPAGDAAGSGEANAEANAHELDAPADATETAGKKPAS